MFFEQVGDTFTAGTQLVWLRMNKRAKEVGPYIDVYRGLLSH
jgi:hypothetical protein